ncbi:hypothetical protein D1F64_18415 [Breoghania sp. L-A4]|nr:hypothetical protein D1F64_18415 [Breoghania sp. L-A4]
MDFGRADASARFSLKSMPFLLGVILGRPQACPGIQYPVWPASMHRPWGLWLLDARLRGHDTESMTRRI